MSNNRRSNDIEREIDEMLANDPDFQALNQGLEHLDGPSAPDGTLMLFGNDGTVTHHVVTRADGTFEVFGPGGSPMTSDSDDDEVPSLLALPHPDRFSAVGTVDT